jgi:hypothetical protein
VELSKQLFSQYTADMQKNGTTTNATQVAILGWFFIAVTKLSRFSPS